MIKTDPRAILQWTRWCIVAVVKIPMAWLYTSTLSMEYDDLDVFGRVSMTASVLLAWYAIIPQIQSISIVFYEAIFKDCGNHIREHGMCFTLRRTLPLVFGFLALVFVVFSGLCHDLSLVRGCTMAVMNNSSYP